MSSARTRALSDYESRRNLQVQPLDQMNHQVEDSSEDHDRLLKDATAAADICRCNPCRCDPLLNDCSVSCNPVVDASAANQPPASGCGCGCKKKEEPVTNKAVSRMSGCGCNCGGGASASSSHENIGELSPIQFPVMPCHPQEALPCSQPTDLDPCCIVVCLKHLKRQLLIDRPKCCA